MKIHLLCLLIYRISKREVRNKKADTLRKKSHMHLELGLAVCTVFWSLVLIEKLCVSPIVLDLVLNRLFMSRGQNLPISLSVASVTLTLVSSLSSMA